MSLLNHHLQAFLAIHEESTVVGAAKKMGLVPTAVTQRIRALEHELGVTLFTRNRKGMSLTPEGNSLLKYCLGTRELESRTLAELREGGRQSDRELRVAGPTSFISGRAVSQCKHLFKRWPRLNIQFVIDDGENRLDLIKKGKSDIVALNPHEVPLELDSKSVKPDEYLLLAHPTWKSRDIKEILETERIFAFHSADQTSLNYLKQFNLLKFLKRPRLFVNENFALSALLLSGVGFGVLTREIARPFIEEKSLIALNQGKVMKYPLALAWYPRIEMPAYFKELIDSIH